MVGDLPSIYERSWVLAPVEKREEGRVQGQTMLGRGTPDEVRVPSSQLRRPTGSFCLRMRTERTDRGCWGNSLLCSAGRWVVPFGDKLVV